MRRLFAAISVLCLMGSSANAGGPEVLRHSWAGPYMGLSVGHAWGTSRLSSETQCPPAPGVGWNCSASLPGSEVNVEAMNALGRGSVHPSELTGALHGGLNWQSGNLVYGAEIDLGLLGLSASRSGSGALPYNLATGITTISNSIGIDWLMTARGRVGQVVGNAFVYATAGLAIAEVETTVSFRDQFGNQGQADASRSKVNLGWTLGAGAEWTLDRHWSFKGEYLYVDLGTASSGRSIIKGRDFPSSSIQPISGKADATAQLLRLGLNYRF